MLTANGVKTGWRVFGATMLTVVGALNICEGLIVVVDDQAGGFDSRDMTLVPATMWASATVALGAMLALTGAVLYRTAGRVRPFGVSVVALHGISQLVMLRAYPEWSLLMIALDVLLIFALTVPGPDARTGTAVGTRVGATPRRTQPEVYRPRHKAGLPNPAPARSAPRSAIVPATTAAGGRAIGQATVVSTGRPEPIGVAPTSGAPTTSSVVVAEAPETASLTAPQPEPVAALPSRVPATIGGRRPG